MFCGNCGKKLEEGTQVCPYCLALTEVTVYPEDPMTAPETDSGDRFAEGTNGFAANAEGTPEDGPETAPQPTVQPIVYAAPLTPPKDPKDTLALVGFCLGVTSLVICCIPFVPVFVAIAALILSIMGLQSKRLQGLAIAGIITGGLGLLFSVMIVIMILSTGSFRSSFSGVPGRFGRDILH